MKKPPVSLTLQIAPKIYDDLCEIARLVNRPPDWLLLYLAGAQIEQTVRDGFDFLLPCIRYGSKDEAEKVAAAVNAFNSQAHPNRQYEAGVEYDGTYTVCSRQEWEDQREISRQN